MNFMLASPSLDDLVRVLRAWRIWILAAVLGALIGVVIFVLVPPAYRARATVNVDFNLEAAWPQDTDRQQFYYLERESRKLQELAWSDAVMQPLAAQFHFTVEELRGGKLQLSQPADAGWHFYADDADAKIAAALASAWAQSFVSSAQEQVTSGDINQFVRFDLTQAEALPTQRHLPVSDYLLVGATGCMILVSLLLLFIKPKMA